MNPVLKTQLAPSVEGTAGIDRRETVRFVSAVACGILHEERDPAVAYGIRLRKLIITSRIRNIVFSDENRQFRLERIAGKECAKLHARSAPGMVDMRRIDAVDFAGSAREGFHVGKILAEEGGAGVQTFHPGHPHGLSQIRIRRGFGDLSAVRGKRRIRLCPVFEADILAVGCPVVEVEPDVDDPGDAGGMIVEFPLFFGCFEEFFCPGRQRFITLFFHCLIMNGVCGQQEDALLIGHIRND